MKEKVENVCGRSSELHLRQTPGRLSLRRRRLLLENTQPLPVCVSRVLCVGFRRRFCRVLIALPPPALCSGAQPADGGGSDGDEEGGRGQRHPAVPPPVPLLQLPGHRVAAADAKLQAAESGRTSPIFQNKNAHQCKSNISPGGKWNSFFTLIKA